MRCLVLVSAMALMAVAASACSSSEAPAKATGTGGSVSGASGGAAANAGSANAGNGSGGKGAGASAGMGGAGAGSTGSGGSSAPANSGGATGAKAGASSGGAVNGGAAGSSSSGAANGGNAGNAGAPATGSGGGNAASTGAIERLREYLAMERSKRAPIGEQTFATVALTKDDSATARGLLWDDHAAEIRASRAKETSDKAIAIDGKTLRYDFKTFGSKPATGRSLYISLHGGGEAAASVNDEQWENQKGLYEPDEGVYLAPRAPTNTWNLWHEAHIDGLLGRLIEDMIVFVEVDSNHVYVMGYSAGGDGVYQLGPRMADSWAAAAMMAGHPNDAKPDSLRNIGFTIHVGGLDSAYDRNLIAGEWDGLLDALEDGDPGGYAHLVQVHANKPHWMDLEDAVAVPWMAEFTRDPIPRKVVWLQDDVPHQRFYWLSVPAAEAVKATRVVASYEGQAVRVEAVGIDTLRVRLSDAMLNLDQPVSVSDGSAMLFSGAAPRTIATLATTLSERGDPALMFPAEVEVTIP